jgi:hypothetical protein
MRGLFESRTGADVFTRPLAIVSLIIATLLLGYLIAKGGIVIGVAILALIPFSIYIYLIFDNPRAGIIGLFIFNFFALGAGRYIPGVPLGLGVDAHLIIIYLSLFAKSFSGEVSWHNAKREIVLLAAIWYLYAIFQLVNPEAVSRAAWFYAMRGVSLYMLLTIPLVFIIFNKRRDLSLFFLIWGILSLLGTLKGVMQKFIGPDPWEQAWLNAGGELTHILFGKLRVFSFFSDAGQFGGAQGHAGVVFLILAYHEKRSRMLRLFYGFVAILAIYGMMISGTRGSIAVPLAGLVLYIVLQKNIKAIVAGGVIGVAVIYFFMFTSIGQGNYTINRMRSAFNPQDASLMVRVENQRRLKSYMASRPFGGGIGSAGNWGMRFSPNTFLAQTPTDSWYVMIWAEQGIVGLILHLFILFYIVIKSSYIIMFKIRDDDINAKMSALVAGLFGVMVASYANGVLGQMPTGIIIYMSMAFLFLSKEMDNQSSYNLLSS